MLPSVGTWMVPSFRAPPVPAVSCQHCMVSDDPCTCFGLSVHRLEPMLVHAFHRLCSLVLSPARNKIVRTICRGSSYLIQSLAISGLSCACLAMTLCDAVTLLFGTPCPGAITSLHFSHGHILVVWSCSVKSKAIRASQLKDVKGKNLDTFDIRAGSGLFFQGTRRSASQRVGGHEQLICNQTSLVNRKMWIIVSIYIYIYVYFDYICWFLTIYVWRVPCKRDEYIWIR